MANDFATSSGHWYKLDGSPCYEVPNKSKPGEMRNTTLRDAKVLKLVPSVTGIIRMAAAPALERYKRNAVLMSALTLPRIDGESEKDWLARVEQDWQEHGRQAAERGTQIHGAIEQFYRGNDFDIEYEKYVFSAVGAIEENSPQQSWSAERSFAHQLGYGGKTDLHSDEWVVDIKTKDGDLTDVEVYDDHALQLAAYRRGLGKDSARCGILFVRRDVPEAKFIEIPEPDLVRGLGMFDCLLKFWQIKNNFVF
jgi:hypothetical protein